MAWDEDLKAKAIKTYTDAKPTSENSTEIIKGIAEELNQSPNGVRTILVLAGVYIKKDASTASKSTKEGTAPRVSKETQIQNLRDTIKDLGGEVNDEILEKLTGKAAEYFAITIKQIASEE